MCAEIQVVERISALIEPVETTQIESIARRLLSADHRLSTVDYFSPHAKTGLLPGPALFIDDRAEIALSGSPDDWPFEYRLALLGEAGDTLVLSGARNRDFELYLRDYLGVGRLGVIEVGAKGSSGGQAMPQRCQNDEKVFSHLVATCQQAKGLSIVPVQATGAVWALGRGIGVAAGVTVRIAGPGPRLSRCVNDKLWFTECVRLLFGEQAHPESYAAYGLAALVRQVHELSRRQNRIVIKLPNSAGSSGNVVLNSNDFRGLTVSEVRSRLLGLLGRFSLSWPFPVQVAVWEEPVLSSPSVHVWIPDPKSGRPIIEGIFEQKVRGPEAEFVGAEVARFCIEVQEQMAHESTLIATLFQRLGYFGRCSFDCLLIGKDFTDAAVHWVECNGRWGGVSFPLSLLNRLGISILEYEVLIVQRTGLTIEARQFRDVLRLLGDLLYPNRPTGDGIILSSPTVYERGTGIHFVSFAKSRAAARAMAVAARERLRACAAVQSQSV